MERVDWSDRCPTGTIEYDDREYRVTFGHGDSSLHLCPDVSIQTETVQDFWLRLEIVDGLRQANFLRSSIEHRILGILPTPRNVLATGRDTGTIW